MITLTFEPTNPDQAALLGKFLPEYMRAGELHVEGTAEQVKAVVETAAEVVDTEKPAASKRTRAAKPAPAPAPTEEASAPSEPSPSPSTPAEAAPAADVTLEQVRAKLASLSQAGKAAQVKGLIAQFGVAKLTDVPAEKYGQLMQEAEAL